MPTDLLMSVENREKPTLGSLQESTLGSSNTNLHGLDLMTPNFNRIDSPIKISLIASLNDSVNAKFSEIAPYPSGIMNL